ncbi:MAG: hypothetical protein ACK4Z5_05035 [Brevundimonas sp.]
MTETRCEARRGGRHRPVIIGAVAGLLLVYGLVVLQALQAGDRTDALIWFAAGACIVIATGAPLWTSEKPKR